MEDKCPGIFQSQSSVLTFGPSVRIISHPRLASGGRWVCGFLECLGGWWRRNLEESTKIKNSI